MKQTLEERFWAKVEKIPFHECWEWTACKTKYGYGRFKVSLAIDHKFAHRIAYELTKGPIPKEMHVCHTCDNPSCVRPEHLWLGDRWSNMADKVKKGRQSRLSGQANPMSRTNRLKRMSLCDTQTQVVHDLSPT